MTPQGMADNLYFGSIISHTNDDDDAKSKPTLCGEYAQYNHRNAIVIKREWRVRFAKSFLKIEPFLNHGVDDDGERCQTIIYRTQTPNTFIYFYLYK